MKIWTLIPGLNTLKNNVKSIKLKKQEKFELFSNFIKRSTLQLYINKYLMCNNFEEIKEIFEENFFKFQISFRLPLNPCKFCGQKGIFNVYHLGGGCKHV